MTTAKRVDVASIVAALTKALEEATTHQIGEVTAEYVDDALGRRVEVRATVKLPKRRGS